MMHLTNEQLIDYLHNALAPAEDAHVHTHLDQCEQCREAYAAEAVVGETLRAYAQSEERELPSPVKGAIWERIRSAHPSPWRSFVAALRPAIAIPVLAAIALAAYFVPQFVGGSHGATPTIQAAYFLQDHADMNGTIPFGDHSDAAPAALVSATAGEQTAIDVSPAAYTADGP